MMTNQPNQSLVERLRTMSEDLSAWQLDEAEQLMAEAADALERQLAAPAELPPLPPYDYYVTLGNGDDYGCWSSSTMREYARAAQRAAPTAQPDMQWTETGRGMLMCASCGAPEGKWAIRPASVAAAPQEAPQQEPLVWESTTVWYIKYITDKRYQAFSPEVRKWYKPICQKCAAPISTISAKETK